MKAVQTSYQLGLDIKIADEKSIYLHYSQFCKNIQNVLFKNMQLKLTPPLLPLLSFYASGNKNQQHRLSAWSNESKFSLCL